MLNFLYFHVFIQFLQEVNVYKSGQSGDGEGQPRKKLKLDPLDSQWSNGI